jgi:predicted DNA-binding transcriptional regulator AlpA
MTRKASSDLTQPLNPDFFYRRHGPIARGVIGLEDSQIDEKIKTGELPPLVQAFASGRATGWLGSQLIELQRQRLAKALAAEVEPEPVEPEPTRQRAAAARRTSKPVVAGNVAAPKLESAGGSA